MNSERALGLEKLLAESRDRLRRIIHLRIDRRILPRVDASDIVQEAYVEAAGRYQQFCDTQDCSEFIWLRFLTLQKLAQLHRKHVGAQGRSVLKEQVNAEMRHSPVSSVILAEQFVADDTAPVDAAIDAEEKQKVADVIESLANDDREILAMRHFEGLSNAETAEALGIESGTCYKRYARALQRFKKAMEGS